MSEDITDGYGPELYEIRKARRGEYLMRAHYYASHQQTVFGPATCTLTVYTDWGRPDQRQRITTTRLDKEHQMVPVGTVCYAPQEPAPGEPSDAGGDDTKDVDRLAFGMSEPEVISVLGEPVDRVRETEHTSILTWERPGRRTLCVVFSCSTLSRVIERTPWGDEMVIMQ